MTLSSMDSIVLLQMPTPTDLSVTGIRYALRILAETPRVLLVHPDYTEYALDCLGKLGWRRGCPVLSCELQNSLTWYLVGTTRAVISPAR